MELDSVTVLLAVLKSAIELDLLELIKRIGDGVSISPAKLAAQLPVTNPEAHIMVDRILRVPTSYNIINCSIENLPDGGVERWYSLAAVCKFLTKNEDGASLASLLLLQQDRVFKETW
ncbi:hypothetical protein BUALT_Bualt01G0030800 [Buddleja alternifolia]|uniref:O-methyltransferase dimerisation domain-containing protein n=1 Tax=Buddleja alternifolia TaxID=168488 RepID=A0AAV6YA25_9LAMI|nr:hypothetical protein BUALT_Bualt01G0030800 [Buddleja alternifolia]